MISLSGEMSDQKVDFQKILLNINYNSLLELLHSCVDDIRGKKRRDRYDEFKSSTQWSREEYDAACVFFKELLCRVVASNTPLYAIREQYSELSTDHLQCVTDCLTVRMNDIKEGLMYQSAMSGPVLQDFDWKLKWIIGSSSLSSVREPLLNLNFNVHEGKDGSHISKVVNLELNGSELKTLIMALEKAEENIKSWES